MREGFVGDIVLAAEFDLFDGEDDAMNLVSQGAGRKLYVRGWLIISKSIFFTSPPIFI